MKNGTENNFTAIRLIAAISVLWGHSYALAGRLDEPTAVFFGGHQYIGDIAVDVFFITSGFLLARSFNLKPSIGDFIVARALRIYPGLIVCNLAIVALSMAIFHPWDWSFLTMPETLSYLAANSVLFPSNTVVFHLPGVFEGLPNPSVNGSFWTLPGEIKAYAYMVALICAASLLRTKEVCPPMSLLYATMAGIAAFAYPALPGLADAPFFQRLLIYFFVGATMFELAPHLPLKWPIAIVLCAAIFLLRKSDAVLSLSYLVWPYLTLFAAYKVPYSRHLNRVDISYGLYIYGFFSQNLIVWSTPHATPFIIFLGGSAVASILATASWFLVEKPALAIKGRLRNRGRMISAMPSQP